MYILSKRGDEIMRKIRPVGAVLVTVFICIFYRKGG